MEKLKFAKVLKGLLATVGGVIPDEKVVAFIDTYFHWYKTGFVFTMNPEDFPEFAYGQLIDKIVSQEIATTLERIKIDFPDIGEAEWEVYKLLTYYFGSATMPNSVATHDLNVLNNCFVIALDKSKPKLGLGGTYRKVPTTVFGKKELKMFNWPLPDDCDLAMVFNKDGIRMTTFLYGKGTMTAWAGFYDTLHPLPDA